MLVDSCPHVCVYMCVCVCVYVCVRVRVRVRVRARVLRSPTSFSPSLSPSLSLCVCEQGSGPPIANTADTTYLKPMLQYQNVTHATAPAPEAPGEVKDQAAEADKDAPPDAFLAALQASRLAPHRHKREQGKDFEKMVLFS